MSSNCTSMWKLLLSEFLKELPLFKFERLDILCAWIRPLGEKIWPFEILKSFRCSISSVSICVAPKSDIRVKSYDHLNFECLVILCTWIGQPNEKLWPFEFLECFRCSISSVSIYYSPESDFRVKRYDHLNLSRASIVQFRASRYIMRLNLTSELKVMTIWISPELPLFNFERLDILCALWHPS